nr:sigma-54-dependent Fis family transcriptional regulator [bacterium]
NPFAEREVQVEFARFLEAGENLEDVLRARKILDRLMPSLREDGVSDRLYEVCVMLGQVEHRLGNEDGAMLALIDAEAALPESATAMQRANLEALRNSIGEPKEAQAKSKSQIMPLPKLNGDDLITQDAEFKDLLGLAAKVAATSAGVLLMGETGTGKGVLARIIHRSSPRVDCKFIHVNCAAMPEELLESELFGHVKGAFTGAIHDKTGLIQAAEGGTLFLDEVGKTSLRMQGKLLQFLDTGEVRPVGSNQSIAVELRLITASKTDLQRLAEQGLFLEDLYFRLNDFPLRLPPLRDRKGDIPILAEHFIERHSREFGEGRRRFDESALDELTRYDWPGNVRELEKVVRRALLLGGDQENLGVATIHLEDGKAPELQPMDTAKLQDQLGRLEKDLVSRALLNTGWNRSQASRDLGISYPTLLQKIRKYDLSP